ncbi:MAG TPA: hypothetical protein VF903_05360 [Nitrospirota bacterium]
MKKDILDHIARGVALGAIAWFGLRGVLPDISAAGDLAALLAAAVLGIVGYAIGSFTYRCTYRCDSTCEPRYCRAM